MHKMASGVSLAQNFSSTSGGFGGAIKIPGMRSEYSWKTKSFESQPSQEELNVYKSVLQIERWWIRMKNRKVFRVLKEAICAAEHSLTQEVLRKVSPLEAELLKDPTIKAKVKFRFGGNTFPPVILFKVFTSTVGNVGGVTGGGVQYISGRRLIRPASEAAEDSRRQMGNRKFYDQMFLDACQHHQLGVTDEVDVTTMKEYMQYAANVDESPAYLGGKENSWRRLNLDVLPRHSLLHNLVEYLEQSQMMGRSTTTTTSASLHRLQSLARPPTQHEQIEHIKTVSSLQSPMPRNHHHRPTLQDSSRETLRRSRQAQRRAEKMRRVYRLGASPSMSPEAKGSMRSGRTSELEKMVGEEGGDESEQGGDEMNEIEREADELYQWSQELSFENIG